MYKILVTSVWLFSIIACTPQEGFEAKYSVQIDPEFEELVWAFEAEYNVTVNVSISFANGLPDDKAGICYRNSVNRGRNYIKIDKNFWNRIGYYGREQLIFHELGHCVMYLDDSKDLDKYGQPLTIMYYQSFGDRPFYAENRDYYLDELGR